MTHMNRRIRLASLCVLTMVVFAPAVLAASPAKTYLLRQTYTPGTYYLVTNVDTRQQKAADRQADSDQPAPEMNIQQIWVVKMIVGNPDEKGNKTIILTYERFQQTTNVGDVAISEYDSKAPKDQAGMLEQCFGPLRKAKITILLDKDDNVVSVTGMKGIWTEMEKNPNVKPMIGMMKKSFNNKALKKMILFSRDFLPANPVAVGDTWSNEQMLPTMTGNVMVNMDMTFASVEKDEGRRQALIVFSGKTKEVEGIKNAPANSSHPNTMTADIQQKGMLRFDLATGRVSEMNVQQTMVFAVPVTGEVETEDNNGAEAVKITTQSAIATKEYVNEIPPELTEPPSTAPASAPVK